MKKPKIDLSKNGLKDFFFRHTEKLFFGLAVALIILFFWLGFRTPAYDATSPARLLQTARQAEQRMDDSSNWKKIADYRKPITDAADRIENARPLDSSVLTYHQLMGTGVRSLDKRTDPAFLKPGKLEIRYIRAEVAKKKPKPDADKNAPTRSTPLDSLPAAAIEYPPNQKGESFIHRARGTVGQEIVTVNTVIGMALIDYEAQLNAYRETFEYQRGYDANRDIPEYAFIEVQRKTETTDWTPISSQLVETYDKVDGTIKDVIKEDLSIPNVTMDIPPFLGIDYREITTLPEMEVERAEDYAAKKDDKASDEAGKPSEPGGLFGPGDDASKDEAEKAKAASDEAGKEEKISRYRLIRFFDLLPKQPGEKYSYRVRLWFKDPNNPENFTKASLTAGNKDEPTRASGGGGGMTMDEPDTGGSGGTGKDGKKAVAKSPLSLDDVSASVRRRLLQPIPEVEGLPKWVEDKKEVILRTVIPGEWVESEQPVTITRGFETFVAGPVDAPTPIRVGNIEFHEDEPQATIVANSFQNDLGVFVPAETSQIPGSILNFRAVAFVLHPLLWDVREVFESVDSRGQKTGRLFETDAVLVDAMGGQREPFSRRPDTFFAPAEVMIMDRNGKLIIRNDIEDETSYRHAKFTSVKNQEILEKGSDKKGDDKKGDDEGPGRG